MTTLRDAAQQALEALQNCANGEDDVLLTRDALAALRAALAEPTLTQQMTDAGFTPRDNRLTCDECGGKFTRQMLPIHKCAALADPVQEPVAWIQPDHLQKARVAPFLCRVEPTQRCSDFVALYSAPPQRKPLTGEEIKECERQAMVNGSLPFEQRVFFARAIERTHGIK